MFPKLSVPLHTHGMFFILPNSFPCICQNGFSFFLERVLLCFMFLSFQFVLMPVLILSRTLSGASCKICRYLLLLSPSIPLLFSTLRLIASFSIVLKHFKFFTNFLIIYAAHLFNQNGVRCRTVLNPSLLLVPLLFPGITFHFHQAV